MSLWAHQESNIHTRLMFSVSSTKVSSRVISLTYAVGAAPTTTPRSGRAEPAMLSCCSKEGDAAAAGARRRRGPVSAAAGLFCILARSQTGERSNSKSGGVAAVHGLQDAHIITPVQSMALGSWRAGKAHPTPFPPRPCPHHTHF